MKRKTITIKLLFQNLITSILSGRVKCSFEATDIKFNDIFVKV